LKSVFLKSILLAVLAVLFNNCSETTHVAIAINSTPSGAQIIDEQGQITPHTTPAIIPLAIGQSVYQYRVAQAGYKSIDLNFNYNREIDFMSSEEAIAHFCIAPCCLGIPLLRFLDPADVIESYEPHLAHLELKRSGGGVFLEPQFPLQVELIVDGKSKGNISGSIQSSEVFVPLENGPHTIEFHAKGFKPLTHNYENKKMVIQVSDEDPVLISNIKLTPNSTGLYLIRPEGYPLDEIVLTPDNKQQSPIIVKNIGDERFFTLTATEGSYHLKLTGTTVLGKLLEHTQKINISTLAPHNLKNMGPWKNIKAMLGIVVKKGTAFDVGESLLTREFMVVKFVKPGTPSSKIGIQAGDILKSINGYPLSPRSIGKTPVNLELAKRVSENKPGESLSLLVERSKKLMVFKIDALVARYYSQETLNILEGKMVPPKESTSYEILK